jgi:hypothetical protein
VDALHVIGVLVSRNPVRLHIFGIAMAA